MLERLLNTLLFYVIKGPCKESCNFTEAATRGVLQKNVFKFLKFCKIHRKTPVLESLFNKVAGFQACILLKRYSNAGVFLWNLKNICERLNSYNVKHLWINTSVYFFFKLAFFVFLSKESLYIACNIYI